MPANYVLLEKITVGAAGASSVTFSGIPQTGYTDLVIKFSTRGSSGNVYNEVTVRPNGSSANLSARILEGSGTSASSFTTSDGWAGASVGNGATANTFSNGEIYFPNYTSSNYKSFTSDTVGETNATAAYSDLTANLWSDTAAITSIELRQAVNLFQQFSTFYLYGVAKLGTTPAIVPYATGGNTIMTDGTYWYHTFLSSGTFTPQKAISCDYLVVAGGGAGGYNNNSGGGGAGGLRSTVTATGGGGSLESPLSLASGTGYTVTIGAGGAGQTLDGGGSAVGASGSNSVFATITSTGGGGGAGGNSALNGANGGSGGGATYNGGSGGTGTANQGFNGGGGVNSAPRYQGNGGGGAGAVGNTGTIGNGGNGVATSISGSSVTYAGGGGGATQATETSSPGGTGGGGTGAGLSGTATAGTVNTGSGGGAAGNSAGGPSASGGSGIVVVRYAV